MTVARFDDLIHPPTRLAIMSLLAATEWADFKYIRDTVGMSDSALSKQLSTLEAAGYIEIHKGFLGKRPRTTARLSSTGRGAFESHAAALREIVGAALLGAADTLPVAPMPEPESVRLLAEPKESRGRR